MTVIKRTRIKFFAVMSAIIIIIISVFCVCILLPTYTRNVAAAKSVLENMVINFDVKPPSVIPGISDENRPDRFNDIRGFSVKLDAGFEIIAIKSNDNLYTEDVIREYVASVKESGSTSGRIGDLEYLLRDTQGGIILAFLDVGIENSMFNQVFNVVILAGSGGIAVLLILVWFLSFWIIKPTAEAFQKQKRFVSEAGHELKTPLSVISASIELMKNNGDETENKKWLEVIRQQSDKMSIMTTELLTLSKLEETKASIKTEVDLYQTVLTEVLAFESVAFESGKTITCDADGDIIYKGDAQAIRQAVRILCDNAIKHSEPSCEIVVRLKKQASKIVFSVSNAAPAVKKEEIPLLFERFYRGSESRAETAGTGLGLAILKTLAEKNGWDLKTDIDQKTITFSIIF